MENPQLLAVDKLTDGAPGLGRYRMRFGHGARESTVTYTRFDPPRSWATASSSSRLDVRAEGEIDGAGPGSRLVVRTQLLPHGPLRPLAPLLRRYPHHAWDRNLTALKAQLENRREEEPPDDRRGRLREPVRQQSRDRRSIYSARGK